MKKLSFSLMALACFALASCQSDSPKAPVPEEAPLVPDARMELFVERQSETGFGMFGRLVRDLDARGDLDNFAYSPFSFSTIFALAANGAESETLDEMLSLYGDEFTLEEINGYYRQMAYNFPRLDNSVTLSMANSIWVDSEFSLTDHIKSVASEYYSAEVMNRDFSSSGLVPEINGWISRQTGGMINEYFEKHRILDPPSMLLNTLYFKAPWCEPFDKKDTRYTDFSTLRDGKVRVPMMLSDCDNYARTDDAVGLRFDLGKSGSSNYSMYFILPSEDVDFMEYVADFDNAKFEAFKASSKSDVPVIFHMPRFRCDKKNSLTDAVRSLGVTRPFSVYDARFGRMFEEDKKFFIGDIQQQVVFEAVEEGVEAAAVTSIELSTGVPMAVTLDRPFMFVLAENATGMILFEGVVTNPAK